MSQTKTADCPTLGASSVEVRCGACGDVIGHVMLPGQLPPFSSLSFELRTMLKPLLGYVRRRLPALAPAVDCWTSDCEGATATLAAVAADGWRSIVTCPGCLGAAVVLSALPGQFTAFKVLPRTPEHPA